MGEHTALPWKHSDFEADFFDRDDMSLYIYGSHDCGGPRIARVQFGLSYGQDIPTETLANAEFIVRACNSHDALLQAARDAEWALEGMVEDEELGDECAALPGFDLCGAKCCEHSGCAVERLARVRAAIAAALSQPTMKGT